MVHVAIEKLLSILYALKKAVDDESDYKRGSKQGEQDDTLINRR